jgi:hypothetical protein
MKTKQLLLSAALAAFMLTFQSCSDDDDSSGPDPVDPTTATRTSIDRFSADAGTLMVRTAENGLPAADEAIDFDTAPFITTGLGPDGEVVEYYNFDVMSTTPAPIYVLRHESGEFVEGQLNIITVVPGDAGYNDFWDVVMVTVPDDYVANTITSYQEISAAGYAEEQTDIIVNCPVVPEGSTATKRVGGGSAGLVWGWYRGEVIFYFDFSEKALTAESDGSVPVSPIYVSFNINADETGGGPASGFVVEDMTDQTHNVLATLPDDDDYSPLWGVNAYDNAEFDDVMDLATAEAATGMNLGATVNCPVASIEE